MNEWYKAKEQISTHYEIVQSFMQQFIRGKLHFF